MDRLCPTVTTVLTMWLAGWPAASVTAGQVHATTAPQPTAFSLAEPDPVDLFPAGWWFTSRDGLPTTFEPRRSALWWLPDTDARTPIRVLRVPGVLSMPAVLAEQNSLVVAAYQSEGNGATLQLLRVDLGQGRPAVRVIYRQPVGHADLDPNLFAAQAVTTSPDGRYYTLPTVQPPGTALVRTDGTLVTIYRDAFDPCWSPDGQFLVLRLEGPTQRAIQIAAPQQPQRGRLIPEQVSHQPAIWSSVPHQFWQLVWHKRPQRNQRFVMTPVLALCSTEVHASQLLHTLWPLRLPEGKARNSVWFIKRPTRTRVAVLVCTVRGTGEIWTWNAEASRTVQRFIEVPVPLVRRPPLLLDDGSFLSWIGTPPGVPLHHDPTWVGYEAVLPDAGARLLLYHGAAQTVRQLLDESAGRVPPPLTSLLPWPWAGDLDVLSSQRRVPQALQLARRVASEALRMGADLPGDTMDRGTRRALLESTMFLAYVAGQYGRTLRAADELDSLVRTDAERERLILVRLFALAGAGRYAEARAMLEALAEVVPYASPIAPGGVRRQTNAVVELRTWTLEEMDRALARIEQRLQQVPTDDR